MQAFPVSSWSGVPSPTTKGISAGEGGWSAAPVTAYFENLERGGMCFWIGKGGDGCHEMCGPNVVSFLRPNIEFDCGEEAPWGE